MQTRVDKVPCVWVHHYISSYSVFWKAHTMPPLQWQRLRKHNNFYIKRKDKFVSKEDAWNLCNLERRFKEEYVHEVSEARTVGSSYPGGSLTCLANMQPM